MQAGEPLRLGGVAVIDEALLQGAEGRARAGGDVVDAERLDAIDHEVGTGLLGGEPIHWLSELPRTAVVERDIFLCHGAPGSDTVYLLEDVMDGLPEVRSEGAIRELLQGVRSPVVLCGHTHIPRVVELSNGQLVVNPGSVGVPAYDDVDPVRYRMQNFSPHACYAILEKNDTGWNVSLERVAYNHQAAAEYARTRGRDDWAQGIATGRM